MNESAKSFFIVVNPLDWSWDATFTIVAKDPSEAIHKMLAKYEKGSEPSMAKVYASAEDYFDRDDCLEVWINKNKVDGIHIETNDDK